jgi:Na+/H+ antiporter
MHVDVELVVVLVATVALAAGAAMQALSARTRVPYTIAMLVLGLLVGFAVRRLTAASSAPGEMTQVLGRMEQISPHLIIFVFLPALVFQSAFAFDPYLFRKKLAAIGILAGPALLACAGLTAALMVGLTRWSWGWGWSAALVFGALISATDPVSVVAILDELGAPKRLRVFVEGESLLNDGTSIVTFSVLLGLLGGAELAIGEALLRFVWFVVGGAGVGLALALLASAWIRRIFNKPLVEISLTIVLAYAAMIVAEKLVHVSGVIAVVTAGLTMSSIGKTRISPEVSQFLGRFWDLLSYIANTLIFFLVGVAISTHVERAALTDLALVAGGFLGAIVIRFLVVFALRPLLDRVGGRISAAESVVLSWGGLRGAVSLALALIVSQQAHVDAGLRQQILVMTAGVVLLTILVNGSSTGWLLRRFGYDRPAPSDQLAQLAAGVSVLEGVQRGVADAARDRQLMTVWWREVTDDLERRLRDLRRQVDEARTQLSRRTAEERAAGYWREALRIEQRACWLAFAGGTISPRALRAIDHEIELQLDRVGHGDIDPPPSRARPSTGPVLRLARRVGFRLPGLGHLEFERLELQCNLWRGQIVGAEAVLASLDLLQEADEAALDGIRATYRAYLRTGREKLEELRLELPEVTRAIETRLARRIALNLERDGLVELAHRGALTEEFGEAQIQSVEERMRRLGLGPRSVPLPETADLCRSSPLLAGLDAEGLGEVAVLTRERALSPGEVLFREGDAADSLYIVGRGALSVEVREAGRQAEVGVLGGGDVVGEVALLSGASRHGATVRAITTVVLGEIRREGLQRLFQAQPGLGERLWRAFDRHRFESHARQDPRLSHVDQARRLSWLERGESRELEVDAAPARGPGDWLFISIGTLRGPGGGVNAPALLAPTEQAELRAASSCRVVVLPELDRG